MQLCAGLELNSGLDLICCLVGFLCLLSSHQSCLSGNIFVPFWNRSAGNSFWLAHWYNFGVPADYTNNPHLSYNQFDRLDENTAVAQTFLCLWLHQIVVPRVGAQPRPPQALGRLSGGEEAHTHPFFIPQHDVHQDLDLCRLWPHVSFQVQLRLFWAA